MIDREKLVALIREGRLLLCSNGADTPEKQDGHIASYLIDQGLTVERWIPVTERLPEPFKRVIVCREGLDEPIVEQGQLDVNGWWKVYGTRTKRVTHWMPLPEPPEEG